MIQGIEPFQCNGGSSVQNRLCGGEDDADLHKAEYIPRHVPLWNYRSPISRKHANTG